MRINTITCHDVYNVGASLQAYALSAYLQELGHQVEIIDYKPDYLSGHYSLTKVNSPRWNKVFLREIYLLAKLPGRVKALRSRRKAEFDRFKTELLPVTDHRYISNDDLKAHLPSVDVYLAGSDQIWNCVFPNGKDPAFYLDFAPNDAIKASYAASFSTEDIPEEWKPKVKQWLANLDSISVRESSGVEIIRSLGISGAVQVLDPVFLLSREHWETIAEPIANMQPYILIYDFDGDADMISAARKMADRNDWKLYSVLPCKECDRCFSQVGPLAFLSLVKNAQFVVSNSFHATAFSLIFQKEFAVCKRKESINTRMEDLLTIVNLEDRMINGHQLNEMNAIEYSPVAEKLEIQVRNSKRYLERVLEKSKERAR